MNDIACCMLMDGGNNIPQAPDYHTASVSSILSPFNLMNTV